jgi:predicted component of type VI protein secretion system
MFSWLIRAEESADATIAPDESLVRTALRVECAIRPRLEIFRWRRKLRVFYNSYC